jgi:NADH-quinone oxidoreductase subunit D
MTVFLYCFREREDLLDCYEAVSGARMHAAYYRPGGVYRDLPDTMPQYQAQHTRTARTLAKMNDNRQGSLLDFLDDFCARFPKCVDDYETLLTENRIWKQRTVGVGVVSPERAIALGFTGPMLRGSGVEWDLRKKQPYAAYDQVDFDVAVGVNGDTYDRYLVRIEEMRQSKPHHPPVHRLAAQEPGPGDYRRPQGRPAFARRDEGEHGRADPPFQAVQRRHARAEGEAYAAVEHPKGEFGVYFISDGANMPYRMKLRSPRSAICRHGRDVARPHARRRGGDHQHA